MMRPLLLALILAACLAATPALACHHYTRWAYPWRQQCKVSTERKVMRIGPRLGPQRQRPSVDMRAVQRVRPEPPDPLYAIGLAMLKQKMEGK